MRSTGSFPAVVFLALGTVVGMLPCSRATAAAGDPRPLLDAVQAAVNRNDDRRAMELAEQAVSRFPESSEAYRLRALVKRRTKDLAGAERDATKAIELDPRNASAWNGRANARVLLKDLAGALADCDRSVAVAPGAKGLDTRAYVKLAQKDFAGALADASRAVELEADNGGYWIRRSDARLGLGDLGGAEHDLDRAIALAPKNAFAYSGRAWVRERRKDHDGSVEDYSRALELGHPERAILLNNRGMGRKALGDLAGARSDLEKAVAADPGYATARKNLAQLDAGTAPKEQGEDKVLAVLDQLARIGQAAKDVEDAVSGSRGQPRPAAPPRQPDPAPPPRPVGSTVAPTPATAPAPPPAAGEGARSPDAAVAALEKALRAGSVDAAVPFVHPSSREQFRQLFGAHRADLPRIAQALATRAAGKSSAQEAELEVSEAGRRFTVVLRKRGDLWFVFDL